MCDVKLRVQCQSHLMECQTVVIFLTSAEGITGIYHPFWMVSISHNGLNQLFFVYIYWESWFNGILIKNKGKYLILTLKTLAGISQLWENDTASLACLTYGWILAFAAPLLSVDFSYLYPRRMLWKYLALPYFQRLTPLRIFPYVISSHSCSILRFSIATDCFLRFYVKHPKTNPRLPPCPVEAP